MEFPEKLVITGFILVTLGIAILGLLGASEGNGFFVVFPFFFFGSTDDTAILPFIVMLVINVLIFGLLLCWGNRLWKQSREGSECALLVEGKCRFCGSPIPKGSEYCPSCGKAIRYMDDEIA
ncbi:MAG: zinc ribbon domain-containing protein [Candidatus Thorarchaeota archaeon]